MKTNYDCYGFPRRIIIIAYVILGIWIGVLIAANLQP